MDKLGDMLAFVRVVESKTFTAAADRLGWSKSVVSRRISELEDRLGVRLLNRSTRRLSLTEPGQAYYERCSRILSEIDETEESITRLNVEPRGLLRLNAPVSFAVRHLSGPIAEYMLRYPQVSLDLVLNDRLVDVIDEGFDLALRIGSLADSSLIARRLAVSRSVVCASPRYLADRELPAGPEDLTGHDCYFYSNLAQPDQRRFRDRQGRYQTVRLKGRFRVNNGDVLEHIAIAGLGIVILPTFIVADALADGRLVRVLPDHLLDEAAVHAIYPHNRHLSAKVRAFVSLLVDRFTPDPPWDRPILHLLTDVAER